MNIFKLILKAFVVIALVPILIIGGILVVSNVATMCFGGISHPLMSFLSVVIMLPWGFLLFVLFFFGVGVQPTFVITPVGQGGYIVRSGKDRGGGIIFSIIRLIIMVPLALIIWIIVSIMLIYNKKLQTNIEELYIDFFATLKKWYKLGLFFFVVAPLVVVGFNAIENAVYSPKYIEIEVTDFYYDGSDSYKPIEYFNMSYTLNINGKEISEIKGYWMFIDKNSGESIKFDDSSITPFDWYWSNDDKSTNNEFTTVFSLTEEDVQRLDCLSNNLDDLLITYNVTYISYDSNIPILGEFLFPKIDNEYKDGYLIIAY